MPIMETSDLTPRQYWDQVKANPNRARFGFGQKAALINIDPIVVGKWAEDRGISYTTFMDLSGKPEVAKLVHREVIDVNQRAEKEHFKIKRYAILYKLLDVDDGEADVVAVMFVARRMRTGAHLQTVSLRDETGVTRVADPLGGSYYVESLTDQLVNEARPLIDEAEEMGGMTRAV